MILPPLVFPGRALDYQYRVQGFKSSHHLSPGKNGILNDGIISGLYYKHMTIINYASIGISKLKASLNDDARIIIYNRHMFIVQATDSRNFQSPILKIQYLNLITQHCALLVSSPQCWVSSPGNAKGGSINVPLTSCLTGLD